MEKGKRDERKGAVIKAQIAKLQNLIQRYLKEILIALVLAVVAAIAVEVYKNEAHKKNIEVNRKATATIVAYDKDGKALAQGSGVFINATGLLVTNYHVVQGSDIGKTVAKLSTGAFYRLRGIGGLDKKADVALLQFAATETPHIKGMGDSDALLSGQKVIVIGSPMHLENSISEGIIANPARLLFGLKFIQFTAPISSGSSGGGLFDDDGKAIGITTASVLDENNTIQNLNLAIPINLVKEAYTGSAKKLTEESPDYYYSLGQLAETKDDWDKAIEYYQKALSLNDEYADAYIGLGNAYYEKGGYDLEVSNYEKAVSINSKNYYYFYLLGAAYEDNQEYAKAKKAYTIALSIKPDHKDTLHDFAILSIASGDCAQANELISKLEEINVGMARNLEVLMRRACQ
jgi:tetratricopeptide (TPR) repeat protein